MNSDNTWQAGYSTSTDPCAHLKMELLGGFQLTDADRKLNVSSRNSRLLLAILAVSRNRTCRRDRLAGMLWNGVVIENARASLRQALTRLRKMLGASAQALWSDHEFVGLQAGSWQVDVDALELAASLRGHRGPLPEIGEFLHGMTTSEPAIDAWLEAQRQRVEQLCLMALDQAMDHAVERGELSLAVQLGLRSLTIDPLRESVHRQLMRIYDLQGDSVRALRHFRNFRDRLAMELGVPPEATTIALFDRIRQTRRHLPVHARRLADLREQELELQRVKNWVAREQDHVLALLEANGNPVDPAVA